MNKKLIYIITITVGLILGFLYWYYIGCSSGTCPLTSKWYTSSLYGGVFGYLSAGLFIPKKEVKENGEV